MNPSELRKVTGITSEETTRIQDFLQGAVYCWCKNRPNEWFALRDLMGGANFNWTGTPMLALDTKHINLGKASSDAIESAAKDGGWVLKHVIVNDIRMFETKKESLTRQYQWMPENPESND